MFFPLLFPPILFRILFPLKLLVGLLNLWNVFINFSYSRFFLLGLNKLVWYILLIIVFTKLPLIPRFEFDFLILLV